jgi:hypothetical protein
MKKDLQNRVTETLNSLDGLQRAGASPFLYSKIRNRLENARGFVPQSLAWRMIAALLIVVLMNVITILHFKAEKNVDNGAQSVASEYSIALPQTY